MGDPSPSVTAAPILARPKRKFIALKRGRVIELGSSEWAPATDREIHATGQFDIADKRSPQEVAELIAKLGYEPVWKDWDAAFTNVSLCIPAIPLNEDKRSLFSFF